MSSVSSGARLLSEAEKLILERATGGASAESASEPDSSVSIQIEAVATILSVMRHAVTPVVLNTTDEEGCPAQRMEFVIDFNIRMQAAVLLLQAQNAAVQT